MISLQGKNVLVTGGSRGIGRAMVEHFLAADANVYTCGRSDRPIDLDNAVHWIQADITKQSGIDQLTKTLINGLDVLVNNAGVQIEKTVVETTDEEWSHVMDTNVKALFQCCRAFIPVMEQQGGGSIINIGSISGDVADPEMAVYNASKSFVHGLTRSIAIDHGPQGIRCNAICPGWIMTEMAEAGFQLANDPQKAKQDALTRHAIGRFGKPFDIAKTAVWLASDESSFATGQKFVIDGGLTVASPLRPSLF